MGETANKEKAPKQSWFTGLKTEFAKIIWPDQKDLGKQTVAVIVTMLVSGLIIALLDSIIQYGVNFLVNFTI